LFFFAMSGRPQPLLLAHVARPEQNQRAVLGGERTVGRVIVVIAVRLWMRAVA
jgi:hypothetical protein